MTSGDDPWGDVRVDLTSGTLGAEATASLDRACAENAEAVGRLAKVLDRCIHGKRLGDVETALERPPRSGLIEDEPGMFLVACGEFEAGGERRKLYRLQLDDEMAVFVSVARDSAARVERFCLPHEVSEMEEAIRTGRDLNGD